MKEKLKKIINIPNISTILIVLISFLCILKININTHIYHDEFVFSIIYGTEQKIAGIGDIFTSLTNLYINHTGRVMVFLQSGNIIRAIVNSAFFGLLIFELIKFSSKGKFAVPISLLIFPMLWCKIPAFR